MLRGFRAEFEENRTKASIFIKGKIPNWIAEKKPIIIIGQEEKKRYCRIVQVAEVIPLGTLSFEHPRIILGESHKGLLADHDKVMITEVSLAKAYNLTIGGSPKSWYAEGLWTKEGDSTGLVEFLASQPVLDYGSFLVHVHEDEDGTPIFDQIRVLDAVPEPPIITTLNSKIRIKRLDNIDSPEIIRRIEEKREQRAIRYLEYAKENMLTLITSIKSGASYHEGITIPFNADPSSIFEAAIQSLEGIPRGKHQWQEKEDTYIAKVQFWLQHTEQVDTLLELQLLSTKRQGSLRLYVYALDAKIGSPLLRRYGEQLKEICNALEIRVTPLTGTCDQCGGLLDWTQNIDGIVECVYCHEKIPAPIHITA